MTRPMRLTYPGALLHLGARGNEKQDLFRDAGDRKRLLTLFDKARERYGLDAIAYSLMTNHTHVLALDRFGEVSRALQFVNGQFAQGTNRKYQRTGHLFEGRFHSTLVESDSYFLACAAYIHRNPLEAGMVSDLREYPYSSYPAYLGTSRPADCLDTHLLLNAHGSRRALAEFTERAAIDQRVVDHFTSPRQSPILGSEAFVEEQLRRAAVHPETNASRLRAQSERISAEIIDAVVVGAFHIEPADLYASRQGRKNLPRSVAVTMAKRAGFTAEFIGRRYGYSTASAVSNTARRLEDAAQADPALAARVMAVAASTDQQRAAAS